MAFPADWPPRPATSQRSIRFFKEGTTSNDYADNAWMFRDIPNANTLTPGPAIVPGSSTPATFGTNDRSGTPMGGGRPDPRFDVLPGEDAASLPKPMLWAQTIQVHNSGANPLYLSFDGVNQHGYVPAGQTRTYRNRYEAGIALKSAQVGQATTYYVEAW